MEEDDDDDDEDDDEVGSHYRVNACLAHHVIPRLCTSWLTGSLGSMPGSLPSMQQQLTDGPLHR